MEQLSATPRKETNILYSMSDAAWATLSIGLGWTLVVIAFASSMWLAFCCPASLLTLCPQCRYPVDPRYGLRCPECGVEAAAPLELNLRRRSWRSYACLVLMLFAGLACIKVFPLVARDGWWRVMPTAALTRWGPAHFGASGEAELMRRLAADELDYGDRANLIAACEDMLRPNHPKAQATRALKIGLAIVHNQDDRGWDVVRAAMHNSSLRVRLDAIESVHIGDCPKVVLESLCEVLESDADPDTRIAAMLTLVPERDDKTERVSAAMVRALRSSDKMVAYYAANYVFRMQMPASKLIGELHDMQLDSDLWYQQLADFALMPESKARYTVVRDAREDYAKRAVPGR
jgi:hypothetical protein